ncbi:hypothetical protein DPMN_094282 [Dreissena polymorpha]|uniref:Uncharacterized protein n=1 Tax=Dreissena polymorpha TaxID=45954 RepID=A0A9D4R3E2_DREPO|nr:hypothetical protein DPMN_094276 [Dreissena polymorpha]KAH3851792.1 hypothetical protein DPMN_094278 [Dreissena polymorpha]KAH3851794.1 hypothetical protein DPMN_094280 [Dreissena polymorpha]KAH3851796.1 hypothetical protein DPMN_094282 [Dreissena polymorpha]
MPVSGPVCKSRAGCLCQVLCARVGLHRLILCQALCARVGLDACVRPCVLESGWMPVSGPVC